MPGGVSEQLLAKAYGPTDLSGFYNAVDNASKQLLAQEREYRRQYLNQYSKELASLQQTKGVKNLDLPEIQQDISNWKGSSMQLMSNKNLIDRDTKKYVELKTGQENSLITAQQKIANSQAAVKEEEDMVKEMRTHPGRFKPNALDEYIANVVKKPTSYSLNTKVKAGDKEYTLRDRELYLNPLEGYGDWYDKVQQGFKYDKGAKYSQPETDKQGLVRTREFLGVPEYGQYYGNAINKFNSIEDPNKKFGFADKVLSEANDYNYVVESFNKIRQDLKSKGLSDKDIGIFGDLSDRTLSTDLESEVSKNGKANTAAKYLAMKHFVDDAGRVTEKPTEFKYKSEAEADKARADIQLSKSKKLFEYQQKEKLKALGQVGQFDAAPILNQISQGGESGIAASKNLVDYINNNPVLMQTASLVTTSPSAKKGVFKNSNDVITSLGLEEDASQDVVAKKMNEQNKKLGLLATVNPKSLTSGKVISLSWTDANGNQNRAYLDAQDQDSKDFLNKQVRATLQSRKDKIMGAESIMGSGMIDAGEQDLRKKYQY